jgi:hypothetical protein
VTQNQAASSRPAITEPVIRGFEGPFRRFAWHVRTSGVVEGAMMCVAGATVMLGALSSLVWLATVLIVAL